MGSADNIITGIILIIIFIGAGTLVVYKQSQMSIDRLSQKRVFYSHETDHNSLNTFLLTTDNVSEKDLGTLLGYSAYKKELLLDFAGETIDVKEKVYETMNLIFGKGNYYVNVSPRIYDIALSFVIDGSDSLLREQQELADILPDIVDAAQVDGREVLIKIYLLSQDPNRCDLYFTGPGGAIPALTPDPDVTVTCGSIDAENNRGDLYISGIQDYRVGYGFEPPYNYGANPSTPRDPTDYYEPDWASGSAHALDFINRQGTAMTSIVFPMGGELATSSIHDDCYTTDFLGEGMDDHDRLFCDLCETSCDSDPAMTVTEQRSWDKVEKTIQLAVDTNQVISPIYAYNCNFRSGDPIWTDWNWVYQTRTGYDPGTRSLCNDPGCHGCSDQGSVDSVCYHDDCEAEVQRQMQEMADLTGGMMTDLDVPADLYDAISVSVQKNLGPFRFTLGRKSPDREKFVYEKMLPLPIPAEFAYMTVYVYKDSVPASGDCGNNHVDTGEACDGTDLRDMECVDFGFTYGNMTCAADCTFSTDECR